MVSFLMGPASPLSLRCQFGASHGCPKNFELKCCRMNTKRTNEGVNFDTRGDHSLNIFVPSTPGSHLQHLKYLLLVDLIISGSSFVLLLQFIPIMLSKRSKFVTTVR